MNIYSVQKLVRHWYQTHCYSIIGYQLNASKLDTTSLKNIKHLFRSQFNLFIIPSHNCHLPCNHFLCNHHHNHFHCHCIITSALGNTCNANINNHCHQFLLEPVKLQNILSATTGFLLWPHHAMGSNPTKWKDQHSCSWNFCLWYICLEQSVWSLNFYPCKLWYQSII